MNILEQYNEYIKAYNELAEKLDTLGASDNIFEELSNVCSTALNLDIDELCQALRDKSKALAI